MNPEKIKETYLEHQGEITSRLDDFHSLTDASEKRLFQELAFVILTSQSSAVDCWKAIEHLDERVLTAEKSELTNVFAEYEIQYPGKKSDYIIENRKNLSQPTLTNPDGGLALSQKLNDDEQKTRDWLAENLSGVGIKAASHFLRNTGRGDELAIISNYIVKALYELGGIENPDLPQNKSEYKLYEKRMRQLADHLDLSLQELDLSIWARETGDVFK